MDKKDALPPNPNSNRTLECSTLEVPMDQFNATRSGDKTFNLALIRLRSPNTSATTPTKNLLLNPGGPGGSGYRLLFEKGDLLQTIVGSGFHLVSFDPRGVNRSTPAATCYPDRASRRKLSRVRSMDLVHDSPEVYAWAQNFVQACADTMGEYAAYVNTPQTAADMNSILDALGQDDMYYWGFSYGTLLGQTYAGLFPERAKRVIIDGVVNQFLWYQGGFEAQSEVDTDAVLDGFFGECVKSGVKNCALASLAESKDGLRDLVFKYMDALRDQPLSVYINNTHYGLVTYDTVWYNGVLAALYRPTRWQSLAQTLYNLIQGNATDAFLAYTCDDSLDVTDDTESFVILNDSPTGPAHWPQDRQSLLDTFLPYFNNTVFPATWTKIYYMRQQWRVAKTHGFVPRESVRTAHPLLILSTSYDPICPLVAARSAAGAFVDSRIVEVLGYGHCSIAVPSVCAAKHIRGFLYEGVLLDGYTRCEVDLPYFGPSGDGEDGSAAGVEFEDEEERRIHLAQVELAKMM
ncbi:Alpha/Beta hydrolase protein [Aspergillus pseudoustus]|uniref:Alpha/Beta hydrolase protein n=1 Tax=Aspergillus pseudoustus TaxID=1810923 RepID=A0ABR4IPA1_9EURO